MIVGVLLTALDAEDEPALAPAEDGLATAETPF